ncbi:unnamed protein product [Leptidea sinapis]|uniref:Protein FAM50 homolog n=5 Tax=Dismorphiinae TaxID=151208 RepID=A0A5E4R844_9NEOP|nr:unnamed protein product [Leptidea sinapis]
MAHYKGAASEAGRAMHLMKKREKAQQEIELRKKKIEEDLKIDNIENKFATHYDAVEQQLKSSTIGLVTLDEMKAKQEHIVREREKKLAQKKAEKEKERQREIEAKQAQKNKQKRQIQALSFDLDEQDEDDDNGDQETKPENSWKECEEVPYKKIRKNPDVDTSFLPDREREEADLKLREELRLEWAMTQASLKDEPITVTFSYWDGSGHRRHVTLKKVAMSHWSGAHRAYAVEQYLLNGNSPIRARRAFCLHYNIRRLSDGPSTQLIRTWVQRFREEGTMINRPPPGPSTSAATPERVAQRCLDTLRPEFSELKTVLADQLMYVKEDLILPHHYTFYDFIVTKVGQRKEWSIVPV